MIEHAKVGSLAVRLCLGQFLADNSVVDLERGHTDDRAAVDEDRRRGRHAVTNPFVHVSLHAIPERSLVHTRVKLRRIQTQSGRVPLEILHVQRILVGEERVVILPEPTLLQRAVGRLGRFERVGVDRQRKILEHPLELIAVDGVKRFEGLTDPLAVGSLEVGELDELHRRVDPTAHRVIGPRSNRLSRRAEQDSDIIRRRPQLAHERMERLARPLLLEHAS